MKFFATLALVAGAIAAPATLEDRTGGGSSGSVCNPGLYSNPICCATDVLGVICLDGDVRKFSPKRHILQLAGSCTDILSPANQRPTSARNFRDICAAKGQQARCCVLPVVSNKTKDESMETSQANLIDYRLARVFSALPLSAPTKRKEKHVLGLGTYKLAQSQGYEYAVTRVILANV